MFLNLILVKVERSRLEITTNTNSIEEEDNNNNNNTDDVDAIVSSSSNNKIPVLLWNARLEEDKDPESF